MLRYLLIVALIFMPAICFSVEARDKDMINQLFKTFNYSTVPDDEILDVEKVYLTNKEEAYLVTFAGVPGQTNYLIRPSKKQMREFYGSKHIWITPMDLDNNGVTEVYLRGGYYNQGVNEGYESIVHINGWEKKVLHESGYEFCDEPRKYIDDFVFCSTGAIKSIFYDFDDINGDGIKDLSEYASVIYVEIDEGVTIEQAKEHEEHIHIKEIVLVNEYFFNGSIFTPFNHVFDVYSERFQEQKIDQINSTIKKYFTNTTESCPIQTFYLNSERKIVVVSLDTSSQKAISVIEENGNLHRLKDKFSDKSTVNCFRMIGDDNLRLIFFEVHDSEWFGHYYWHLPTNSLYYQTKNTKTGKIYTSKNLKKAKLPISKFMSKIK